MRQPDKHTSTNAIMKWFDGLNERLAAQTVGGRPGGGYTAHGHRPSRKLTRKDALQLKRAMTAALDDPDLVDKALGLANTMIGGHGVEPLTADTQVDRYYYNIVALYVNLGDTYETTLLYETEDERFLITSWGSWVEWAESRRRPRYRFE